MTDEAVAVLAPRTGTRAACAAVGAPQASYYRRHRASPPPPRPVPVPHAGRVQPRALSQAERQAILGTLHCERFADLAPAEVWATLLDEGIYLGSVSTFYRVLREAGESKERRRQATHPAAVKPELMAAAPNQVWSWDITKLHGPRRVRGPRREADRGDLRKAGHRPRAAGHPRRPGQLDDFQAGGVPARRPRRHPVPLPPARL
jgi:putative transposase